MSRAVVVVESPSKAKTIGKYLGDEYTVLASYGHVRDLPAKNGSVDPNNQFQMVWEISPRSTTHISAIQKALKGTQTLYLATDPDREGEAISWHVSEILRDKKALNNIDVKRIVFHEITPRAVKQAIENPRTIDENLVDAYLARRALDYLVGFSISPVLWRKLPGARSAGRVQSVALRLIVDREKEIESFVSRDYWTIEANFLTPKNESFNARLTHVNGQKLDKFDIKSTEEAQALCINLRKGEYSITSVEAKQVKRNPTAPFTTSTLQQEAGRKLGFSASRTMQIAQKLYEGITIRGETIGLITYMRTDSVHLSNDAITGTRAFIEKDYGQNYLPTQPRSYKSQAKNAQEAHEAIRPTHLDWKPQDINQYLSEEQQKLYDLIWKRTIASQMESALFDQVSADISALDTPNKGAIFRATGSTLAFDGFLRVYQEGRDEEDLTDDKGDDKRLPKLEKATDVKAKTIGEEIHTTQPPPRFTEASLVKRMEELGIGRPSTYAPLLHVLQDRNYVTLEKRQFTPSDRGRIVTSFLVHFFGRYVTYDFTADMEKELDDIANGDASWKKTVGNFWNHFSPSIEKMGPIRITEVIDLLEKDLAHFLFQEVPEGERYCPQCETTMGRTPETGQMHLKLSKFGAFVGCSRYPDCKHTQALAHSVGDAPSENAIQEAEPTVIGIDPDDKATITLRKGPYGWYLQWDNPQIEEKQAKAKKTTKKTAKSATANSDEDKKPVKAKKEAKKTVKRVAIPANIEPSKVEVALALRLKSMPFDIGNHPDTDLPIRVGAGRFGPYVQYDGSFTSIPKSIASFLDITPEEACKLIAAKKARALQKAAKG